MSFRSLIISHQAYLHLAHNSLVIEQDHQSYTVPIVDIGYLILEDPQITVSNALVSALLQSEVGIFFCDQYHLPTGIAWSLIAHSQPLTRLEEQIQLKNARKSMLWREIIQQKIINQANCLLCHGQVPVAQILLERSKDVKANDSTNQEAICASLYFTSLFNKDFTRQQDSCDNARLNYGYAIIRGAIARSAVGFGFNTLLGLHHHNQFNHFNLCDDLIEPFRPFVDNYVAANQILEFTSEEKHKLVELLNQKVFIDGKNHQLKNAIDIMVRSLATSLNDRTALLKLPKFTANAL